MEGTLHGKSTSFFFFFFFPLPVHRSLLFARRANRRILESIDLIYYYCLLKSTNRDTYNMHFLSNVTNLHGNGLPLLFEKEGIILAGTASSSRELAFNSFNPWHRLLFGINLCIFPFSSSTTTTTLTLICLFPFFQQEERSRRNKL